MSPSRVAFTDFEIENPELVRADQFNNRPAFWPIGWAMVPEPGTLESGKFQCKYPSSAFMIWLRKNCKKRFDYVTEGSMRKIFAFESVDEAVMFKMSF